MSTFWLYVMGNSVVFLVLAFPYDRIAIHIVLRYLLNRSNYRKRKKGQKFLDWLLYRKYRDVLPKGWIIHYYLTSIFYFLSIIATIILHLFDADSSYFRIPLGILVGRQGLFYAYVMHSWYDRKTKDLDPGKTITRKGRNKK